MHAINYFNRTLTRQVTHQFNRLL